MARERHESEEGVIFAVLGSPAMCEPNLRAVMKWQSAYYERATGELVRARRGSVGIP